MADMRHCSQGFFGEVGLAFTVNLRVALPQQQTLCMHEGEISQHQRADTLSCDALGLNIQQKACCRVYHVGGSSSGRQALNAGSRAQGQAEGAAMRLEAQVCAGRLPSSGGSVPAVDGMGKPLGEHGRARLGAQARTREWKHGNFQIEVRLSPTAPVSTDSRHSTLASPDFDPLQQHCLNNRALR